MWGTSEFQPFTSLILTSSFLIALPAHFLLLSALSCILRKPLTNMPAKPSEFEEKEYEAPLYNQLESGTNLIWSPGQVFEHHIGIDRAMLLQNPAVWKVFGYNRALPGVLLEMYDWNFIWRRRQRRPLPDFKLNLFVQAKRCYFYNRRPNHLKSTAIHSPCWRFQNWRSCERRM